MTLSQRQARDDTITEALRAADAAIGEEPPSEQAIRIIAAIKRLRDDRPTRVLSADRIDYLSKVQEAAQAAWRAQHSQERTGPDHDASASVQTPLGMLSATTFRRPWSNGRIAWATEYTLDDEPITIAEIKAAGLARRPTTRNRQRKETPK